LRQVRATGPQDISEKRYTLFLLQRACAFQVLQRI